MLLTYLKIALRNFYKTKTFSLVNLVGVAIGLASVMIILSYVRYELSYDKSYSNAERTYRLKQVRDKGKAIEESVYLPSGLATTINEEFPEVEGATYPGKTSFNLLHHKEEVSHEAIDADSNFFQVFNFRFRYGNPLTALTDDHHVVITETFADRYFPGRNPVGETVNSKGRDNSVSAYVISGVIEDIPSNTHFNGDLIMASNDKVETLSWRNYRSLAQYIILKKGTDAKMFEEKLQSIYAKYDFPKEVKITLQPVRSIHLHSQVTDEPYLNSDIRYVYIFLLIALLILFIASVNYINLTTARSLQRVKEVGVRKVLGAGRKQLSLQFIGESFLFYLSAIPVALIIAHICWPAFIKIVNLNVAPSYLLNLQNILVLSVIGVLTGILSGLYPSLFLSHLQPVSILKDHNRSFKINLGLRKTLIVLQFVISVSLIISTIVIYSQLHYISTMPLGFNKDNLIVIARHNFEKHAVAFKEKLKQNAGIEAVSIVSWNVGDRYNASSSMRDPNDSTKELKFNFLDADFEFLQTMQINLLHGRGFSFDYPSDLVDINSMISKGRAEKLPYETYRQILASRPVVVTEKTAMQLGIKHPVGAVLTEGGFQGTIIGVVRDFQGLSLHHETAPVVLRGNPHKDAGFTYVRIRSDNMEKTLGYIESTWKSFFPSAKYSFSFVDERLQRLYDAEKRLASLFTVFAVLAICIASAGLFSLVALSVQQRTKEIGIRKVLGAGVMEIVQLVTKDFIMLITIAILVASPLAWYAMSKWLENFAFRIDIDVWIFLLAALLSVGVAMLTISVQAVRAAMANPADSLRTE